MENMHLIKYDQHNKVWKQLFENEMGRLAQLVGKIFKGTDTIFPSGITISQVNASNTLYMVALW